MAHIEGEWDVALFLQPGCAHTEPWVPLALLDHFTADIWPAHSATQRGLSQVGGGSSCWLPLQVISQAKLSFQPAHTIFNLLFVILVFAVHLGFWVSHRIEQDVTHDLILALSSAWHRPRWRKAIWAARKDFTWSKKNMHSQMFNQLGLYLAGLSDYISKLYPLRETREEFCECLLKSRSTLFLLDHFAYQKKGEIWVAWCGKKTLVLLPTVFPFVYSLALLDIFSYWHLFMMQLYFFIRIVLFNNIYSFIWAFISLNLEASC